MISGILLAAGFGRRFDPSGQHDKLLAPLHDGRPVLWHSARALCTALPGSLAVIRSAQQERAHWLREAGCEVFETADAEQGQGAALAAAVRARYAANGWVITLADMPWIAPAVIARIAAALDTPEAMAAPFFHGQRGHPVGFGAAWLPQLASLEADTGARSVLAAGTLTHIEVADDGVLRDIDTPADLMPRR